MKKARKYNRRNVLPNQAYRKIRQHVRHWQIQILKGVARIVIDLNLGGASLQLDKIIVLIDRFEEAL